MILKVTIGADAKDGVTHTEVNLSPTQPTKTDTMYRNWKRDWKKYPRDKIKRRLSRKRWEQKNDLCVYIYKRLLTFSSNKRDIDEARDSHIRHIMRESGWKTFPPEMIEAYRRRLLIKRKLKQLI